MDDLLQSQIKDSCKLALPDGLQDLMWDISREVLRAQPADLYSFIADYLSVLLVTRENLSIASRLCTDVCENSCYQELEDELLDIGFSAVEAKDAKEVIMKYFESEKKVKEGNLLVKLMKKTDIAEDHLPEVENAVRKAFLRHQADKTTILEMSSSDSDMDEVTYAARHTLRLYGKTCPSETQFSQAAEKIQAAYRAYGVTRENPNKKKPGQALNQDAYFMKTVAKSIRFGTEHVKCPMISIDDDSHADDEESQKTDGDIYVPENPNRPLILSTASSISLAGSYILLPKYKPYSAHDGDDAILEQEEGREKEHHIIDYLEDRLTSTDYRGNKQNFKTTRISFHEHIPEVIEDSADVESNGSVVEDITGEDVAHEMKEKFYNDTEPMSNDDNIDGEHMSNDGFNDNFGSEPTPYDENNGQQ